MPDAARPVATSPDTQYSLTIENAAELYARAGHPRTLRTVQRYCASGHLNCVKAQTMLGDKYFVEASSVARHIAQIEELVALDARASGPGLSRHDATIVAARIQDAGSRNNGVPAHDPSRLVAADRVEPANDIPEDETISSEHFPARQTLSPAAAVSRPDATEEGGASRHVAQLEREVERLAEDRQFLRTQIATKDQQIAALLERDRETNILVRGLQQMLSPLLRPVHRDPPAANDQQPF